MNSSSQKPDSGSRIHLHKDGEPASPEQIRRSGRPDRKKRDAEQKTEKQPHGKASVVLILLLVLVSVFLGSLLLVVPWNQFHFTPAWIFEHIRDRFHQLYLLLFGTGSVMGTTVVQYLACVLAGAALAACGSIFQGAFKNVLAGPSTMGVMAGGTLGCLVYLLLFVSAEATVTWTSFDYEAYQTARAAATVWTDYRQQIFTLCGALGGVLLVLLVATVAGRGKLNASAMVIAGTVLSSMISQVTMLIQYYMIILDPSDQRIEMMQDLMMGTFDNITTWQDLAMMAVPILICLAVLLVLSGRMNLLSLSEDEAQTMGVSLRPLRYGIVAAGTILTAVVVSFCGHIGFLGFMIPLVGRKLVGPDMRRLLPASMLLGAILLILVFDLAYITGMTGYLNLFTSAIGGVVMLGTLFTKKGGITRGTAQGTAAH